MQLLQKQNAELAKKLETLEVAQFGGNDGGSYIPPMSDERIGRIEGEISGIKHSQIQILVSLGIIAAFVIGFGFYSHQRLDQLNEKVNALPSQISSELRDITKTLAESITAAKQAPPQVILVPAPAPPSTTTTPN